MRARRGERRRPLTGTIPTPSYGAALTTTKRPGRRLRTSPGPAQEGVPPMQDHPNPGAPSGAPCPGSLEHRVQRWVLLELVTVPPPEGDDISKMAFGLKELRPDVEAAVDALVAAGLAAREGDTVASDRGGAALRRAVAGADMTAPRRAAGGRTRGHGPAGGPLHPAGGAHPGQRSVEEVIREMTDRPDEFSARDAIDNAIRDLVGAGLLHRHGPFVFATHAAVRFDELRDLTMANSHEGAGRAASPAAPSRESRCAPTRPCAPSKRSSAWRSRRCRRPELATALQIHPRTARRLLQRLELEDYVSPPRGRGAATTSPAASPRSAARPSPATSYPAPPRPGSRPWPAEPARVATLWIPCYADVVCVLRAEPDGPVPEAMLGDLEPAHATAPGKALLAHRDAWRDSLLAQPLRRLTPRTITDPRDLAAELTRIRQRGYATDNGRGGRLPARGAGAVAWPALGRRGVFEPFAQGEIARLEERRTAARALRIDADLTLSRTRTLWASSRRWALGVRGTSACAPSSLLALDRCGRQPRSPTSARRVLLAGVPDIEYCAQARGSHHRCAQAGA